MRDRNLGRRSSHRTSRGSKAISERREKTAGRARRLRDEKVQRPRGSEARQSVIVFARGIERLRQSDRVVQHGSWHAEVVLRLLADVLLAASPECWAAYLV